MLHEHHLTSAPNSWRVSIKTAVYTVMCNDPITLPPFNGLLGPNSDLQDIKPGISTSAKSN